MKRPDCPGSDSRGCLVSNEASAIAGVISRRLGRSIAAIFLGFLAVVVLSLGADEVLHILRVYPPWGEPMYQPGLNLLALSYRAVFTLVGGYLTSLLAPHSRRLQSRAAVCSARARRRDRQVRVRCPSRESRAAKPTL